MGSSVELIHNPQEEHNSSSTFGTSPEQAATTADNNDMGDHSVITPDVILTRKDYSDVDAEPQPVNKEDKAWILQYAETYSSDEVDDNDALDQDSSGVSTTDRLCDLESQLTGLLAAAKDAKMKRDSVEQSRLGLSIRQCRSELSALEAQDHDSQVVSQFRIVEQSKRDANKVSQKQSMAEANSVVQEQQLSTPGLLNGIMESDNDVRGGNNDSETELSVFDVDNDADDSNGGDCPIGETHLQDFNGPMRWPSEFNCTGWTGAMPSDLLNEWCKDKTRRPPKYVKQGGRGAYRVSVSLHIIDLAEPISVSFDTGVKTVREGRDLVATIALYKMASQQQLYRRMPMAYQSVWEQLAAQDASIAAANLSKQRRRRDDFVGHILTELPHSTCDTGPRDPLESTQMIDCDRRATPRSDHAKNRAASAVKATSPEIEQQRAQLPALAYEQEILDVIRNGQVSVISGDTGCGKSTQVPQLVLRDELTKFSGRHTPLNIVCTQPRRISAVTIAERVSSELGESTGGLCGYHVRMDNKTSPDTRLTFCTTGILLRRLQGDPQLNGITHVFVDEIHERTLNSDFLLVLLKRLLSKRSDLRLVLMSATLNAAAFSAYFWGCPVLEIPGRAFPVTQLFLEDVIERTAYSVESDSDYVRREDDVVDDFDTTVSAETNAVLSQLDKKRINYDLIEHILLHLLDLGCDNDGSVLVFLPGMPEILRLYDLLMRNPEFYESQSWEIIPLHSMLGKREQARAFLRVPRGVRKVVLSTNIAETGITIPDCTVVIDAGKEKQMQYKEHIRMSSLSEVFISRASAQQRAGRAGRVQPGMCLRTYTTRQHRNFPAYTPPEMSRSPLENLVSGLHPR